MYNSIVGAFNKKIDYREAAKLAMLKAVLEGKTARLEALISEFEHTFGKIRIERHSVDTISITLLRCHHVDYLTREDLK